MSGCGVGLAPLPLSLTFAFMFVTEGLLDEEVGGQAETPTTVELELEAAMEEGGEN